MLRDRFLTAAVALPPLIWLLCYAPPWLFSSFLFLCTALGLYEYFTLIQTHLSFSPCWGISWGLAVALTLLWGSPFSVEAVLTAGLFGVFSLALRAVQPSQGLTSVSESLFGVVYAGFLIPHLALVRHSSPSEGIGWVCFVFLVAMCGDTAGYAVGRTWGVHKLIPHISPGKTIEGSIGSIAGSLTGAVVAWLWFLPHRSINEMVCLGLIAGMLAQVGDLCESAIKRACGAKDSGHLLPGHGGILDRLDSLLFPAAFIYYYGKVWG